MPRCFASVVSCWAHARTCSIEPAGEPSVWSAMVWMLSTTITCGRDRSIASTIPASDVSAASHSSSRTAPSRSARMRTCCGLSSALMYSVGPGHQARSWSSNVLLPMPGSPPSRVTDPGTSPPSSTRSSSPMPVGRASASRASMSCSSCSSAIGRGTAAGLAAGDFFDQCVPPAAAGALPRPLRVGRAALGAGVERANSSSCREHREGVSRRRARPPIVASRAATDDASARGSTRRRRAGHAHRLPRLLPHRAHPQGRGPDRRAGAAGCLPAERHDDPRARPAHGRGRAQLVPAIAARRGRRAAVLRPGASRRRRGRRLPPSARAPRSPTLSPRFRAEVEAADRTIAETALEDIERREPARYNLRWILVHMIEEYARHCGHADLLRQAIDGEVGD